MQTAVVATCGEDRQENCRLLFDSGSTRSYITKKKAKALGAKVVRSEALSVARFNDNSRKSITRDVVKVEVVERSGCKRTLYLCVVNFISAPIQLHPLVVAGSENSFKELGLAEPQVDTPTLVELDILIGLDYLHDFIGDEKVRCQNGLVFLDSTVGYVASGRLPGPGSNIHQSTFVEARSVDSSHSVLWQNGQLKEATPVLWPDQTSKLSHRSVGEGQLRRRTADSPRPTIKGRGTGCAGTPNPPPQKPGPPSIKIDPNCTCLLYTSPSPRDA